MIVSFSGSRSGLPSRTLRRAKSICFSWTNDSSFRVLDTGPARAKVRLGKPDLLLLTLQNEVAYLASLGCLEGLGTSLARFGKAEFQRVAILFINAHIFHVFSGN